MDTDFDAGLIYCLDHIEDIAFCAATHNEESCQLLVTAVQARGVAGPSAHPLRPALRHGDHITFNLARSGFNASKYVPYGPVRDVVPYLIRRAQENRSVSGQVGRELGRSRQRSTVGKTKEARTRAFKKAALLLTGCGETTCEKGCDDAYEDRLDEYRRGHVCAAEAAMCPDL